MSGVLLFVAIAVGIAGIGTAGYIVYRIRVFSRAVFGTPDLIEGFRRQEELYESTPKSVSGMTQLELPRILRDFPEFHWPEWRQRCENRLKEYLRAVERRSGGRQSGFSGPLQEQLRLRIEDMKARGLRESFGDIRIHQTEIMRYEKAAGLCRILVQSAVEYRHALHREGEEEAPPRAKEQHRYRMELVYIQDLQKVSRNSSIRGAGMHCPNCGAPVTGLGERHCAYCGGAIEPFSVRVWSLHRIEEEA